jgi:hypothetical protein
LELLDTARLAPFENAYLHIYGVIAIIGQVEHARAVRRDEVDIGGRRSQGDCASKISAQDKESRRGNA